MVAYREHERWAGATEAALLYPVVLSANESMPAPYQVRGFGEPVHLVFIDVGPRARTSIDAFAAQINDLISADKPSFSAV